MSEPSKQDSFSTKSQRKTSIRIGSVTIPISVSAEKPPGEYLLEGEDELDINPAYLWRKSVKDSVSRNSDLLSRRGSDIHNLTRAEVKAILGLRRLTKGRPSLINRNRDSIHGAMRQSRTRRTSAGQAETSSTMIFEQVFAKYYGVRDDYCQTVKKLALPVRRMFLVGKFETVSQHQIMDFVHQSTHREATKDHQILTGFCLIYTGHVIIVLEAVSSEAEAILQVWNAHGSPFSQMSLVFKLYDIPERILQTFVLFPVDMAMEELTTGESFESALKIFVDKVVQFSVMLTQVYQAEDDNTSHPSWSLEKSVVSPGVLDTLLSSNLLYPVSRYLELSTGVLELKGLSDDFEWAYPALQMDF